MANPDFDDLGDFEDAVPAPTPPTAATRSSKRAARRSAKQSARSAAAAARSAAAAARKAASPPAGTVAATWKSQLTNLTVYDAMLIASMLAISLAILLMFLELISFGGIFYQWHTEEAFAKPVVPP